MRKGMLLWMLAFVAHPVLAEGLTSETVYGGGGLPLHVISAGRPGQPEILFIHGFSLSSSSWLQQFESLAEDYRIAAFDLRGHGNSAHPWNADDYADSALWADDVAAVIAGTGLTKPWIVAWSYGGHVALDYVRKHGTANLSGVVLVGSTAGMLPFPPPDSDTMERFARMTRLSMSANAGDRFLAAQEFVTGMVVQPLDEHVVQREVAAAVLLSPRVRGVIVQRSLDNADLKSKLELPVLFMVGSQDRAASLEGIQGLIPQLPQAAVSYYEDTGHMPFIERQARFDAEVKRLVAEGLESFQVPQSRNQ